MDQRAAVRPLVGMQVHRGVVALCVVLVALGVCGCGQEVGEAQQAALSPDACTAVKLTSPTQHFTAAAGDPIVLTGIATCPPGQTPEYQYWVKPFGATNWTRLLPYVPGSLTWTLPSDVTWCVSVVARAVGAPENYQARSSARCTAPRCGNGSVDPGEQCDDGNTSNGDTCDANCTTPGCGNSIVDPGEECDDGNASDGDACETDCTLPRCGNGITDVGEECDDGNASNGDVCDTNCTRPRCGNSIVDPSEECDDGNTSSGDGCDSNCTTPRCGNGAVDASEECDDGNASNGDACEVDCTFPRCGNGITDLGEECDDGNTSNGDACDINCTFPRCGNGAVDPDEQCDDGNPTNGDACDTNCTNPRCGNTVVDLGEQCDDGNTTNTDACNNGCVLTGLAYLKASNTGASDFFGASLALSADGTTLAVGALGEASGATGIGGNQRNDAAPEAGAVYVFTRSGTAWIQQAYIKASNGEAGDQFGTSVALSADGSTLVVSAPDEDSGATGIDGDQDDNTAADAGAVYVFTRSGTTWTQQAYVKASNTGPGDLFGTSVALTADGATLAVGAILESSAASGIDGDQGDDSAAAAGAVYVFARSGSTWSQQTYIKASNPDTADGFGSSLALSADGTTLAVGAATESSAATGIDGNQGDNSATLAGAVYVFARSGTTWIQQAYVKASNTDPFDIFGFRVALSADGATLAVGAALESSAAFGVGGNQGNNLAPNAGAVYVFTRSGTTWSQQAYIKASNPDPDDRFGHSVALTADGATLAVGAVLESSTAIGIGGNQGDNATFASGAAYRFTRSGTTWSQQAYIKASNTDEVDEFGYVVALTADGAILAASTPFEAGGATGVGGNQNDNSARHAGAVYVYQ
jgi:trimeric autotransporter adhesin